MLCGSPGEYGKAKEYLLGAVLIMKENGNRKGNASWERGVDTGCLGEYGEAGEYLVDVHLILKEIGDRKGKASWERIDTIWMSG